MIYPSREERGRYLSAWALGKNLGGRWASYEWFPNHQCRALDRRSNQPGYQRQPCYWRFSRFKYLWVRPLLAPHHLSLTPPDIVFAVLMCVGCFVSFLLPSPEKVERRNGTKVNVAPSSSVWNEVKAYFKALTEKRVCASILKWSATLTRLQMLLLLPLLFFSFFYYAYMSSYLTRTFNVRSRAFSSLVSPFGGVFSSLLASWVLDSKRLKLRTKSSTLCCAWFVLQVGLWTWLLVIHYVYNNHYTHLDWNDGKFAIFYIPNILFFFNSYLGQSLLYWTISNFSTELNVVTRYVSIIRSMESMGG